MDQPEFEKYKLKFDEIVDIVVECLSSRFSSDNYKSLITIMDILVSETKSEVGSTFFDLGVYRDEIDFDAANLIFGTNAKYKIMLKTILNPFIAFLLVKI